MANTGDIVVDSVVKKKKGTEQDWDKYGVITRVISQQRGCMPAGQLLYGFDLKHVGGRYESEVHISQIELCGEDKSKAVKFDLLQDRTCQLRSAQEELDAVKVLLSI